VVGQNGVMASVDDAGTPVHAILMRLVELTPGPRSGASGLDRPTELAFSRALDLFEACGGSDGAATLALVGFSADLLGSIAVDLAADPAAAEQLIGRFEAVAGLPRIALGAEVLRTGALAELPPTIAIEVQLALLAIFAGAQAVSLWTLWPSGELRHVSQAASPRRDTPEDRTLACALLSNNAPTTDAGEVTFGLRIGQPHAPGAALILRGSPAPRVHQSVLGQAAAPVLLALLQRESRSAHDRGAEQAVMGTVERRLARLRFDLHDGPQQDIHLLAQDLSLFREQLRVMISQHPDAERALGRMDDLDAQLVALDGDLRRLSSNVQSPFLQPGSLREVLGQTTDAFAARTGVHPQTSVRGDLASLTDSQQITLLALIREALSNIHKHSRANTVTVDIHNGGQGLQVRITDDGRGFDPETTLVQAARAGHLGLVGMHERVRMLGGSTCIDSRPGGPTVISATLPPWPAEPNVD
jgi:signal transduction histidine kinase